VVPHAEGHHEELDARNEHAAHDDGEHDLGRASGKSTNYRYVLLWPTMDYSGCYWWLVSHQQAMLEPLHPDAAPDHLRDRRFQQLEVLRTEHEGAKQVVDLRWERVRSEREGGSSGGIRSGACRGAMLWWSQDAVSHGCASRYARAVDVKKAIRTDGGHQSYDPADRGVHGSSVARDVGVGIRNL
jgi:hypothetical protein